MKRLPLIIIAILIFTAAPTTLIAQGTQADYNRYEGFEELTRDKVTHGEIAPSWIGKTGNFWYNVLTEEGMKYYIVIPDKRQKKEAFDFPKLTTYLLAAQGKKNSIDKPSVSNIRFSDDLRTFTFVCDNYEWSCKLPSYRIVKGDPYTEKPRPGWPMNTFNDSIGKPVDSPDGKWTAFIKDYNLFVREKESDKIIQMSSDGGLGLYYSPFIIWSPDSKKIMSCLIRPVEKHMINYIESSPKDQKQPKYSSIEYAKPGDALMQLYPRLFDIEKKKIINQCDELIDNQFSVEYFKWSKDSRSLTFEYNKRGHQLYQVIKLDIDGSEPKILINETSQTFIDYSGKRFRYDINDGKEIIWASERDGWNHLYLYDGQTGKVNNQITKGEWVVRDVIDVDENERTVLFTASGKEPGDPYLIHYYRINFDGSGLILLTPGDGNHIASFSPDKKYFVDAWSRVDMPPVTVLRETKTGEQVMELEKADISQLLATGWKMPEVFVSKGRDNKTDIWGMILKPSNFDPAKKYPVIEYIYAGPHGNNVPKSFSAYYDRCRQSLTELGFIVVIIDGMGTSNRSKAFHDVCWKNIKDAGFPDRIIWMQNAAKQFPYMDISNVGIYGKSAGGQNSTGAVLFHPEFYKVAVSVCGCHDNRMDKIWWNEQWMGWPVGPEYGESSNVDNAYRLQGDLFLIVGEMDDNVDPASTYQVVDALIKANKTFDLLTLPGLRHEWGGRYGERRIVDYFVEKIMKKDPPPMNTIQWDEQLVNHSIAN
jgi:dipeptidyl aminopeptidase/acylaminoacyl peptidase